MRPIASYSEKSICYGVAFASSSAAFVSSGPKTTRKKTRILHFFQNRSIRLKFSQYSRHPRTCCGVRFSPFLDAKEGINHFLGTLRFVETFSRARRRKFE
jgi:hypothetical protein